MAAVDRLLLEFGTVAEVLAGSSVRFRRAAVDLSIESDLRRFRDAMNHVLRQRLIERQPLTDMGALMNYLHNDMSTLIVERLRVLHLDGRNHLIRDEVVAEGSIDSVSLRSREVVARALELGTAALIIVHNHPSGDPTPSSADVAATLSMAAAAKLFHIEVIDHLVIGRNCHTSLRAAGLL